MHLTANGNTRHVNRRRMWLLRRNRCTQTDETNKNKDNTRNNDIECEDKPTPHIQMPETLSGRMDNDNNITHKHNRDTRTHAMSAIPGQNRNNSKQICETKQHVQLQLKKDGRKQNKLQESHKRAAHVKTDTYGPHSRRTYTNKSHTHT